MYYVAGISIVSSVSIQRQKVTIKRLENCRYINGLTDALEIIMKLIFQGFETAMVEETMQPSPIIIKTDQPIFKTKLTRTKLLLAVRLPEAAALLDHSQSSDKRIHRKSQTTLK